MTNRLNAIPLALVLVGSLPAGASGGSLHKLWEIDLGTETHGPRAEDGVRPGILSLRFSPDGNRIAVASTPYRFGRPVTSRLFVVHVHNPQQDREQFDIANIASDSEVLGIKPPAISWPPDGDLILAGFNLIRLRDGSRCEIPSTLAQAFLGTGHIVAQVKANSNSPKLEFFDSQCKSTGSWDLGFPEWTLADASTDRGLAAVLRTSDAGAAEFDELVVLDPSARKIVRGWPASQTGYYARFAQRGRVVCAGDNGEDLYEDKRVPPRCMDVGTGKKIAEAFEINGGAPLSAAEYGTRVIASDHSHTWNVFYREYDTALKRRVVWDFDKNAVVASWRPDTQSYTFLGPKISKEAFVFAISPDGEYIAEAGNNILRLYRIEP